MNLDTFRAASIIQDDLSRINEKMKIIKGGLPKLTLNDDTVLLYTDLKDLGVIEFIMKALEKKEAELEERFKNL